MVPTQEKQIFPLNLHWTELQFFSCDDGIQDGRDIQAGLTDQMVYQRYVDRFFVFPVCGVWFHLQNLRFIPTYFVAFFVRMLGWFWFFKQIGPKW
jgi:hypothetical protein